MSVLKRLALLLFCLLSTAAYFAMLAVFLFAVQFWLFLNLPSGSGLQVRLVNIANGMNPLSIARLLESSGVVADARNFSLFVTMTRVGPKLKAGEYAFPPLATPPQILDQIVHGRVVLHRVTFPEGSTITDVAALLEQAGLAEAPEIIRLARDSQFIAAETNLPVRNLEGYLFPETYHFTKTQDGKAMLKSMIHQFWRHFPDEWQARAQEQGLTVQQVVILASMVEKEAVVDAERPVIAGVFFNRLKLNMPLQSDPTAVYDLPGFSGAITRQHLQRQSPYNTYQNRGLPVGPICNPGTKSMRAVLYPEELPYLYFVSNNDGTHRFSVTLEEHQRAIVGNHKKANEQE